MARLVVLPSITDLLRFEGDDAACEFNEEAQRSMLMRPPASLPTQAERKSYAELFPKPIAEALSRRKRRYVPTPTTAAATTTTTSDNHELDMGDILFTMDELNDIAPVLSDEERRMLAAEEEEYEDDEEDADEPLRILALAASECRPTKRQRVERVRVLKADVQRAVETADAEWLDGHALNVRQQPYDVYVRSKFVVPATDKQPSLTLSTLRLAIYHVFAANARAEAAGGSGQQGGELDNALAVLGTLLKRCGLDPDDDAPCAPDTSSLLEFVSVKADSYVFEDYRTALRRDNGQRVDVTHVRVLRALLLKAPYMTERTVLCDAVGRLVEDGREACVMELLTERGEHLNDADVFEVVTRIMLYGTHTMLRSALQALDDDDRVPTTLCHPKTRSTLLHFAAKRDDALESLVRPYSDATLTDRKGNIAAHYSAERATQPRLTTAAA